MKWNKRLFTFIFCIALLSKQGSYALSPPRILQVEPGDSQVTVTLSAVSGASFYCVYYDILSTVSNEEGNFIDFLCQPTPIVTVIGLLNGFEYWFVATVLDAEFNESGLPNRVSATPQAPVSITYEITRLDQAGGDLLFGNTARFCLQKKEGLVTSCIPLSKEGNDIKIVAAGTSSKACKDAKDNGIAQVRVDSNDATTTLVSPTTLGKKGELCIKDPDGIYHTYGTTLRIVYELVPGTMSYLYRDEATPLPVPETMTFSVWEEGKDTAATRGRIEEGGQMVFDTTPVFFSTQLQFRIPLELLGKEVHLQQMGSRSNTDSYVASAFDRVEPMPNTFKRGIDSKIPPVTPSTLSSYSLTLDGEIRGVFHLLDRLRRGIEFASQSPITLSRNQSLDIYWGPTYDASGECSSHACYRWGAIYLSGTDADEWDPYVIWHEFGHFVMDSLRGGFPPGTGCSHTWTQDLNNQGCALSEGFADEKKLDRQSKGMVAWKHAKQGGERC